MNTNPYEVLGVRPEADEEELHTAYVALARRYHPDLHPHDQRAGERLVAINAAYELLSDPDRRSTYDRLYGTTARPPARPAWEPPSPPRWERTLETEPQPESYDWNTTAEKQGQPFRRIFNAKTADGSPLWRVLLTAVVAFSLVAGLSEIVPRDSAVPSGCLGFATDEFDRPIKRTEVPCVSVDLGPARATLPLRVALLGVSWDRGGAAGDLLHVCLGITSRQPGLFLQTVNLPLRLAGPTGSAGPVATGVPGESTGFQCGTRRSYEWPGMLRDAKFLVRPGELGHTLVITTDPPQQLPLSGA